VLHDLPVTIMSDETKNQGVNSHGVKKPVVVTVKPHNRGSYSAATIKESARRRAGALKILEKR